MQIIRPSQEVQISGSKVALPMDLQYHDLDDADPLPMRLSSGYLLTTTHQDAVSATGDGTVAVVEGLATALFDIIGSFVATVHFEGIHRDGGSWRPLRVANMSTNVSGTSANLPGTYVAQIAGLHRVRARVVWSSGTSVTVVSKCSAIPTTDNCRVAIVSGHARETLHYERSGALASETEEVLCDIPLECELQALVYASNYAVMQLRIEPYTSAGALQGLILRVPAIAGTSNYTPCPQFINTEAAGDMGILANAVFDSGANKYMVVLKRPMKFNYGVRVALYNFHETESRNVAASATVAIWRQ